MLQVSSITPFHAEPALQVTHLCKHLLVLILQMQGVDIEMVFVDGEGITVFSDFWDKLFHFNRNVLTALLKRLYRNVRSCHTIWKRREAWIRAHPAIREAQPT